MGTVPNIKPYLDLYDKIEAVKGSDQAKEIEKEMEDALDSGDITKEMYSSLTMELAKSVLGWSQKSNGDAPSIKKPENNNVFKIYDGVLEECDKNVKGVVEIPNTVTKIGQFAFFKCKGLTGVKITNSVTIVEDYAFCQCSGLTTIEIPNSVLSIGKRAFALCQRLTSVKLSYGLKSIGEKAFDGCKSLTSIEIPDSVTSIGTRAFANCSSLPPITIPNSVTSMGEYVFSSLKIENGVLIRCDTEAENVITIPEGVTSI